MVACAHVSAVPVVSASSSSSASAPASFAVVAHAGSTPMHVAHNSWSDTGRVKLSVPREGGVPKLGFPVRPKICALSQRWRQGYIFGRLAVYGGRLQDHFPGGNQAFVPGSKGLVWSHLPSTLRFLIPDSCHLGRGLGIRQSMGWTKVCETARSGFWVLKGNARARMLPENLDHLRVRWISRGTYETAWVTPGHDCL